MLQAAEEWSGVVLEETLFFGVRVYTDGAGIVAYAQLLSSTLTTHRPQPHHNPSSHTTTPTLLSLQSWAST
jgi:hypothetical protein